MTTRDTPTNYDSPIRNAASGSVFSFLVTGLYIHDTEVRMPPWAGPFAITPDMTPELRSFFRRENPRLVARKKDLAKPFVAQLHEAFPNADVNDPTVAALVESHVATVQSLLAVMLQPAQLDETRTIDDGGYRHELGVRVIDAASTRLGSPTPKQVYEFLNAGQRNNTVGLTRHSITSSKETMVRWANGHFRRYRDVLSARTLRDREVVEALEHLRAEARKHPRFSKLTGAELAHAIHEHRDLNESIHRAQQRIRASAAA